MKISNLRKMNTARVNPSQDQKRNSISIKKSVKNVVEHSKLPILVVLKNKLTNQVELCGDKKSVNSAANDKEFMSLAEKWLNSESNL